jgi:hypothetical protein
MLIQSRVAVYHQDNPRYSTKPPYHPPVAYPECPVPAGLDASNRVYHAVREVFCVGQCPSAFLYHQNFVVAIGKPALSGDGMKTVRLANAIISTAIVIGFVSLFHSVRCYSWTPERYFPNPLSLVVFYILPVVLSTSLIISFWLRPIYRMNLCLVLVSIAVSVYGVEFVFMCSKLPSPADEINPAAERARKLGIPYDTRSMSEVIRDLRRQNIDAVVNLFPRSFLRGQADGTLASALNTDGTEILPLGGIANKVTVLGNENGQYIIYESDEHGFHNPKGIWNARGIEVAALGDSFTQGCYVTPSKNFVALIRNSYPAILNLGMVHNGPLLELATLKEYLPSIKPNVVLWFYFEGNDLQDLRKERKSPLLRSYLSGNFSQRLLYRQAEIDRQMMSYVEPRMAIPARPEGGGTKTRLSGEVYSLVKLERLRLQLGLTSIGSYIDDQAEASNLDLLRQILTEARTVVTLWGGTLHFVYLPELFRYLYPSLASKHRDRVLELVRTVGIPIIDLDPSFRRHGDPLALFPFRIGYHYNEGGHHVVAEEILRSIGK